MVVRQYCRLQYGLQRREERQKGTGARDQNETFPQQLVPPACPPQKKTSLPPAVTAAARSCAPSTRRPPAPPTCVRWARPPPPHSPMKPGKTCGGGTEAPAAWVRSQAPPCPPLVAPRGGSGSNRWNGPTTRTPRRWACGVSWPSLRLPPPGEAPVPSVGMAARSLVVRGVRPARRVAPREL